jgi:acyl-CoA reductase-like NAD-dependent aldehyde dehydrogenase
MATDRIISHSSIPDNLKNTVKRLLNENSFAPPPTLVSMASKARVTEIITSALSAGAEVVHGVFHDTATENLHKGLAMAKKIQSGAVHINSMTVQDEAALPHGGLKTADGDDSTAMKD